MKKMAAASMAFLALVLVISCGAQKKTEAQNRAQKTTRSEQDASVAPAFTLQDAEGRNMSLADFKGKVVILDFWATWCGPCRREIPHFVELQNQYGSQGLQVVGIAVDQDGWNVVKPFIAQEGINYPILMYTEEVYNAYQQHISADQRGGIPFTFVIDQQGIIRAQFVGYRDKATFDMAIKPLLGS